jgi:hypothetical protein
MSKSKKIINRKYNKNTKKSKKNRTKKSRKHRAKKMMGGAEIVDQCSICHEEMLDNEKLITCLNTIAQHTYHKQCILVWCCSSNTLATRSCLMCNSSFSNFHIDMEDLDKYITSKIPRTGVTFNNLLNLLRPLIGSSLLERECYFFSTIMVFVNNNGNYSFNGFITKYDIVVNNLDRFLSGEERFFGSIKNNNRISRITNNFSTNNIYLSFGVGDDAITTLLRLYIEVDENNNGNIR